MRTGRLPKFTHRHRRTGLFELSAVTLETLPPPEVALERHDRTLFQYLRAARNLLNRVVGSEPAPRWTAPVGDSLLAQIAAMTAWSDEHWDRLYRSELADLESEGAQP